MNANETEAENEHSAEAIDIITVDPDDVVEVMKRNHRDAEESRTHVLRVSPPLEGEKKATPHVSDHGTYYPPEMSPKPLHLGAQVFVAGAQHPTDMPDDAHHPDRLEEKSIFRDEYGYDPETEEYDDLPEEYEDADEAWDEWWTTSVELWEQRVRQYLDDKTATLIENNMQGPETEVELHFEDEE